jgi:hypothetical protein
MLPPASVKVTVGFVPLQNVFKTVSSPVPESVDCVYVGVRFAGPASVTVQEAVTVVETLNVVGTAYAPAETAAKSVAPTVSAVAFRANLGKFKASNSLHQTNDGWQCS